MMMTMIMINELQSKASITVDKCKSTISLLWADATSLHTRSCVMSMFPASNLLIMLLSFKFNRNINVKMRGHNFYHHLSAYHTHPPLSIPSSTFTQNSPLNSNNAAGVACTQFWSWWEIDHIMWFRRGQSGYGCCLCHGIKCIWYGRKRQVGQIRQPRLGRVVWAN